MHWKGLLKQPLTAISESNLLSVPQKSSLTPFRRRGLILCRYATLLGRKTPRPLRPFYTSDRSVHDLDLSGQIGS